MSETYDFVVIGGGSAGYAAARTSHELGMTTAVIDGAEKLGGLCILRGCMPSKTLIESSNRYRSMRRAKEFGLRAEKTSVRPDEIIARKRALIEDFADYRIGQLEDDRFDLLRGTAAFTGPHTLRVTPLEGGTPYEVEFKSALIATGSVVSRLPFKGLEETGYWTSDEILEAEALPESMIVLGGGAIAMEMACYLEGLDKHVTIIQRSDQLLSDSDRDIAKALEGALAERENISIFTGTKILRVSRNETSGRKRVVFEHRGEETAVEADEILQALGRPANTAGLHAYKAGVELHERSGKVHCDLDQRTSREHIFAAGDVCSLHELVHIAVEQGEIAAHNAAVLLGFSEEPVRLIDYRLKIYCIFTDPQIATVGLSEKEAAELGRAVKVASYPFDDHGKSMVMGETHGFVKMIADEKTGEIVGAAVVGPEAVTLIHEVVVAMYFLSTVEKFAEIPHYHPTLSEIWTYPAEELLFSD
ncbi:MAG: NAD(P)/FAD-dependent oxidoreductase [Verrucomicrobiales bacterium]